MEIIHPSPLIMHKEPDRSDPPPHSRWPELVGVPASPWMWAKARSKLGAVNRLCEDGVVSKEARMGVVMSIILHGNPPLLLHTHRTGPFRPTNAL